MYRIASKNIFAGYADSVVPIRYHPDGFYILCEEAEAEGFCAKMAVTLTDEDGKEYQTLSDTVFRLAGKLLKGTEPEGSYEEMGAALPLTDAETAAKILLGGGGMMSYTERARALRPYIEKAAVSLADEDALQAVELFPQWVTGHAYAVNERL